MSTLVNLHLGGASFPRLAPLLQWLFLAHLRSAAALVALTELHAAYHEARQTSAAVVWTAVDAGPAFAEAAALVYACTRRMRVPSLMEDDDDDDKERNGNGDGDGNGDDLTSAPASFGTWPRLGAVAAALGIDVDEMRAWLVCCAPLRSDVDAAAVHATCDAVDVQCERLVEAMALVGVHDAPAEADEWRTLARMGEWRVQRLR